MRRRLSLWVASLALVACGGGGGSAGQPAIRAPSAASATPPTLVQTNSFQTQNADFTVDTPVQFNAPTAAGNAIWVAVTVPDFGGIHPIAVSDTQGNTYTLLDQQNDGAPGSQSVAHFYAANIHGDASTPDTVTVSWAYDNYKGVLIAEIGGATQAPLVGHSSNIQDGLAAGTDNVTAGPIEITAAQTPALILALSMNTSGGTSDLGGSGAPGPAAGSGSNQVGMLWNWGANLATFATGTVTAAESSSSLFSAAHADSYVTVAAAFH